MPMNIDFRKIVGGNSGRRPVSGRHLDEIKAGKLPGAFYDPVLIESAEPRRSVGKPLQLGYAVKKQS